MNDIADTWRGKMINQNLVGSCRTSMFQCFGFTVTRNVLTQFYVYIPLSSSSNVVELSVETFGSFEESFFDFAIDFATKIFHLPKYVCGVCIHNAYMCVGLKLKTGGFGKCFEGTKQKACGRRTDCEFSITIRISGYLCVFSV